MSARTGASRSATPIHLTPPPASGAQRISHSGRRPSSRSSDGTQRGGSRPDSRVAAPSAAAASCRLGDAFDDRGDGDEDEDGVDPPATFAPAHLPARDGVDEDDDSGGEEGGDGEGGDQDEEAAEDEEAAAAEEEEEDDDEEEEEEDEEEEESGGRGGFGRGRGGRGTKRARGGEPKPKAPKAPGAPKAPSKKDVKKLRHQALERLVRGLLSAPHGGVLALPATPVDVADEPKRLKMMADGRSILALVQATFTPECVPAPRVLIKVVANLFGKTVNGTDGEKVTKNLRAESDRGELVKLLTDLNSIGDNMFSCLLPELVTAIEGSDKPRMIRAVDPLHNARCWRGSRRRARHLSVEVIGVCHRGQAANKEIRYRCSLQNTDVRLQGRGGGGGGSPC